MLINAVACSARGVVCDGSDSVKEGDLKMYHYPLQQQVRSPNYMPSSG